MKPRIEDMTPTLATRFMRFSTRMAEEGVPFALNSVLRTYAEQLAYAAQGRSFEELVALLEKFKWVKSLEKVKGLDSYHRERLLLVNSLRSEAGMSPIGQAENSYCVTWTLNSRHFPAHDGKSRAFDIVILRGDKRPTWDEKYDGDQDLVPDYEEAARIGEECGLVAGARWTRKDWPHFELPEGVA